MAQLVDGSSGKAEDKCVSSDGFRRIFNPPSSSMLLSIDCQLFMGNQPMYYTPLSSSSSSDIVLVALSGETDPIISFIEWNYKCYWVWIDDRRDEERKEEAVVVVGADKRPNGMNERIARIRMLNWRNMGPFPSLILLDIRLSWNEIEIYSRLLGVFSFPPSNGAIGTRWPSLDSVCVCVWKSSLGYKCAPLGPMIGIAPLGRIE